MLMNDYKTTYENETGWIKDYLERQVSYVFRQLWLVLGVFSCLKIGTLGVPGGFL